MSKKRIGIIGCGHWGPKHIRNFHNHSEAEVVRICDLNEKLLAENKKLYPGIETTKDSKEITQADDIDAVIIATPVNTHYKLSKESLLSGKDVLCEKPLTIKTSESQELCDIAEKNKLILMVGHVFLYNPGVLKIKELIQFKEVGDIYYLHAQRTNLGIVRNDVSAVYDLASHDIYVFNYLLDATPKVLAASGKCYLQPNLEDVAFISLEYPNNVMAHVHVSWLDPKKVRGMTVVGNKKMIAWDDMAMTGPVQIYSKRIEREPSYASEDYGSFKLLAKEDEILIPAVKNKEPLKMQAEHFMECIIKRKKPLSDGHNGLEVVKTLEEIENILAKGRSPEALAAK